MNHVSERLELWGGAECTINRVGDRFFSQLGGRTIPQRLEDLERFASLGIRALRLPLLWEELAPAAPDAIDWRWPDAAMQRMRELGIRPIVGLLHHGSGPAYTGLLDPKFPQLLAQFARAIAERFPWADAYTPVNEPLTTARFSALYGHWFPHSRDPRSFARALFGQIRGVAAAMQAVREVNPQAQLIQTEDLGVTFSPPELAYQAAFENERRWLSLDLLTGKFDCSGAVAGWLIEAGVDPAEFDELLARPCRLDVVGLNHYVTSARYLDNDLAHFAEDRHGGNGRDRYVDTEAVRAAASPFCEPRHLLWEAWQRYQLPLAITEAHLGCTREEQMRWFAELWNAASSMRREGVPVIGVAAWALLGCRDWDSLLTRHAGHYEAGAFDMRSSSPRPTALAAVLRQTAQTGKCRHPLLETSGWWRRNVRLLDHVPAAVPQRSFQPSGRKTCRPLLIFGATGTLGQAFARICELRGLAYRLLSRADADLTDREAVRTVMEQLRPWAAVNCTGYVRVDDAEHDRERCFRENSSAAETLAVACSGAKVRLVTFSSDLVFDGEKAAAYLESDSVNPLNVYGASKAQAEVKVLSALADALVVRTSSFFGPWDEYNFVTRTLADLRNGFPVEAPEDVWISPTYVPDLVHAALDLLIDAESGIWHLANEGGTTWADLARKAADAGNLDSGLVRGCAMADLRLPAARPSRSILTSERGILLGPWEGALDRYMDDRERFTHATASAVCASMA